MNLTTAGGHVYWSILQDGTVKMNGPMIAKGLAQWQTVFSGKPQYFRVLSGDTFRLNVYGNNGTVSYGNFLYYEVKI